MQKQFIKNRKGQKIAVIVEQVENQRGLAFVMHGLGGFKEQPHILTIAVAFQEKGYTTIRFDTTNTIGESDGNFEDATTTNYYEDLEDVIKWTETQKWYEEPFCLAGHSLGGICTALYAQNHSKRVKCLAPISTVVSGKLTTETANHKEREKEWKESGWRIEKSVSKPDVIKKLKWSHMADRLKYDLLPNASKLTMPVLLIVGERDETTPLEHQRIFYNALPGPKELHIISGAPHTFREDTHLEELNHLLDQWLKNNKI
ncbi:alpha/beta hydrolase [Patescibacteria group bacterium]|nr:MAG: alpha/beta hydrolase [Patescibacteria group bacterium]